MAVVLSIADAAEADLDRIVDEVEQAFGHTYAQRLDARLTAAIEKITHMPARFTRVRALMDRRYDYRRVLSGKHRIIFTLDEARNVVEVVRVDLQRSDPASLDDLP